MAEVPAAYPAQNSPIGPDRVEHHPGPEERAGCSACGSPDHLELMEQVVTHRAVEVWLVAMATLPEVVPISDEWSDRAVQENKPVKVIGVRCTACRWSYTGPNPMTMLRAATA